MGNKRSKGKGKLPPFVAVFRHTTKTDAWKTLSVGAKATFVALQSLHNDRAQNAVWISARDSINVFGLGQDRNAIGTWLKELEHYGFVVMVQGAHLGLVGKGTSAHYRLTDRYHAGKPPTYDFQMWDGVVFEPTKPIDKRGISRLHAHLKKQNPVSTPRTVCQDTTDIRGAAGKAGNGNKCQDTTDIRNDSECQDTTDIATSPYTKPDSTSLPPLGDRPSARTRLEQRRLQDRRRDCRRRL
jgi:hypothetical protein